MLLYLLNVEKCWLSLNDSEQRCFLVYNFLPPKCERLSHLLSYCFDIVLFLYLRQEDTSLLLHGLWGLVESVVKSSFSLNPYSRVFFNEAIEEVVQH